MANILHIIESLSEFGGTPRKLLYLAQNQSTYNHKNHFFCYLPSTLHREFNKHECPIYTADTTNFARLLKELRHECIKSNIEIICTHFTRSLLLGTIIGKLLNLPVIHNEHSSTNYRKGLGMMFSKFAIPFVEKIVCNSEYTKNSINNTYLPAPNKTLTIYNPVKRRVDQDRLNIRAIHDINSDDIIVGHIGGMIPSRDQITLIRAFTKAKSEFNNMHLILIGDGPCKNLIQKEIKHQKLTKAITLTGYTNNIASYLNEFDIYVNTTTDEGFGIAVAEAMLERIPTIAANSGAHPELITDNITGILHRNSDVNHLAQIIIRLATNNKLRKSIGENGHNFIESNFSPEIFSKKYYSLIKSILNSD